MSGKTALRGFYVQSIVAAIVCLERDDWDEFKLEPTTVKDKVDFKLYYHKKTVSSVQVKSSERLFQKHDVKSWLGELRADSVDSGDLCLCLVGDHFAQSCMDYIKEINANEMDNISVRWFPFNIDAFRDGIAVELFRKIGLGSKITLDELKINSDRLFAAIQESANSEKPLTRVEFEGIIRSAGIDEREETRSFLAVKESYLKNASRALNSIRTFVTGCQNHVILGDDSIYEPLSVNYSGRSINADTIDSLVKDINKISREKNKNTHSQPKLLIQAPGGMGKTMFLRRLFLVTAQCQRYIPVLVDLFRVTTKSTRHVSFTESVYSCIKEFEPSFTLQQFEDSMQLGGYLILLDGFDEVPDTLSKETAATIEHFCAAYPKNIYIITSRPETNISPFQSFAVADLEPLSREKAISLSKRLAETRKGSEDYLKAQEFCRHFMEQFHQYPFEFTQSPLLLSMMFLTYVETGTTPQDTKEFYNQTFEVLFKANYSARNVNERGRNPREFQSGELSKHAFKKVFSRLCFQSFLHAEYKFDESTILGYIEDSLRMFGCAVNAECFLEDLLFNLCLVIRDRGRYCFSHRSFQEFFSAYYTKTELTDDEQGQLYQVLFSQENAERYDSYFRFLFGLDEKRFIKNALKNVIQAIQAKTDQSDCPNLCFLRIVAPAGSGWVQGHNGAFINLNMRFLPTDETRYYFNAIRVFAECKLPDLFSCKGYSIQNYGFLCSTAPATVPFPWQHNDKNDALLSSIAYCQEPQYGEHIPFYRIPSSEKYSHDVYFDREFGRYFYIDDVRKVIRTTLLDLEAADEGPKLSDYINKL